MSDTQPWYSQLLRMLKDVPRTLPQRSIGHSANARREGNGTVPSQQNDVDGLQSIYAIP